MKRFLLLVKLTCSLFFGVAFLSPSATAQNAPAAVRLVPVDTGWASNSVNTVVFRKNSLVSFGDTQFISFYDRNGAVVLGKRKLGTTDWQLKRTPYRGNAADAHNSISIMVDGRGYLHMAWNHHNNPLHYVRSVAPGSLDLSPEMPMTGKNEDRVSYPEFFRLPDGNLLFLYRDGSSGGGNLVVNRYDAQKQQWTGLHSNLIDGEGQRNAYWQACVDAKGVVHLSWVWRESPDVASNHDLCYARSADGGSTWEKSTGEQYQLPITAATTEYACRIPEGSELINQTSIFADGEGQPFIATYWRDGGTPVPQYRLVFQKRGRWHTYNLGFRQTPFTLRGGGTKRIPVSRPQIIAWKKGKNRAAALIFRDEEQGSRVTAAVNQNLRKNKWRMLHLAQEPVGSWEPTYDTELWKEGGRLHLFVQNVEQADAEGKTALPPQPVMVLEWDPANSLRK